MISNHKHWISLIFCFTVAPWIAVAQPVPAPTPVDSSQLVLPEIAAALARGHGRPEAAKAFVLELKNLRIITFVDLDESIADLAVDIAVNNRLRGSDAVYGAVALRFGTEIVTLDKEQLDRLSNLAAVHTP